jgi:hypothetical protein
MSEFLTVERIEFAVTYRCNSRCRHCQVGPEKRASWPAAIDAEVAVRVVREVGRAYAPSSLMTFGGEPLLYPEVVCAIHRAAREVGIAERQIITNAGWPRAQEAFRAVADRLAASGVNDVHVSVDAFHQEHIPLEVVERNVRALAEAGIGRLAWNPCWVVSEEHNNPWNERTRAILQALAHLPVERSRGNDLQPMGNAPRWLGEYLPARVPFPAGTCGDLPYTGRLDQVGSIFLDPDGAISVCDDLVVGYAQEGDVVALLEAYDPYRIPEARALLEGGLAGLLGLARSRGVDLDPAGYYTVCDACKSLRRRLAGATMAEREEAER